MLGLWIKGYLSLCSTACHLLERLLKLYIFPTCWKESLLTPVLENNLLWIYNNLMPMALKTLVISVHYFLYWIPWSKTWTKHYRACFIKISSMLYTIPKLLISRMLTQLFLDMCSNKHSALTCIAKFKNY
jgi:hypothetical protein